MVDGPHTPLDPRAPGVPFGRYVLLRKIATGGMGEVFLARLDGAGGFAKQVVIKKIRPELAQDPEFVSRFQDEAHTLVQLQHSAIAQVFDLGDVAGEPYLALEWVDGKDLKSVLARCVAQGIHVPTAIALHVMVRVLDALAYAHQKKDERGQPLHLVHRDVSPPNVLIGYDGDVKVIDFGLAKTTLSLQRTQAGAFVGKFFYMSPEAARHERLDARADLFAVAVVLHETLLGHHVLEGLGPGELMLRLAQPTFPPLSGRVPGVSSALDRVLQHALDPAPARRFSDAAQMRAALAECLIALAPSLDQKAVGTFMRTLFAAEYADEHGARAPNPTGPRLAVAARGANLSFLAPSGTDPTLRGLGAAAFGSEAREQETGRVSMVEVGIAPPSDAEEYVPPQEPSAEPASPAGDLDDPSMAATFFESQPGLARPAAPVPVDRPRTDPVGGPFDVPAPLDASPTVLSYPRAASGVVPILVPAISRAAPAPTPDTLPPTQVSADAPADLGTHGNAFAAPTPDTITQLEGERTGRGLDDDGEVTASGSPEPRPSARRTLAIAVAAAAGVIALGGALLLLAHYL